MEFTPTLQKVRERFVALVNSHGLRKEMIQVDIGILTSKQAIGEPYRHDFALLGGKEVMIEAVFKGSSGQAFTNQPKNFKGSLDDVLNLSLYRIDNRALFIATMNSVCSHLGVIGQVRHCRDKEPENCGREIAERLSRKYGKIKIGMVGYQPAIPEKT